MVTIARAPDRDGRSREAQGYGYREVVYDDGRIALRAMHGKYGSLYEVAVFSSFALGRISTMIATHLPPGLEWQHPKAPTDVTAPFLMHFWKDGTTHRAGDSKSPVSKSGQFIHDLRSRLLPGESS